MLAIVKDISANTNEIKFFQVYYKAKRDKDHHAQIAAKTKEVTSSNVSNNTAVNSLNCNLPVKNSRRWFNDGYPLFKFFL